MIAHAQAPLPMPEPRRARRVSRTALPVVAALLLAACATGHPGGGGRPSGRPSTSIAAVAVPPFPVVVRPGLVFARFGVLALALDAYLPGAGPRVRPAVVLVHGGGWQGGSRLEGRLLANALATEGIAAFSVEYRIPPAVAEGWPAQVDDVEQAIRWVRRHARALGVDPRRIGVAGSSAGGTLAGVVAGQEHGTTGARVRVAALFSAPTDLPLLGETCRHFGPQCGFGGGVVAAAAAAFYVGMPGVARPALSFEASPVAYVNHDSAPTFVVNAANEGIPVSQATAYGDRLTRARVAHVVRIVPGSGHGFLLLPAVWPDLLSFLRRYL